MPRHAASGGDDDDDVFFCFIYVLGSFQLIVRLQGNLQVLHFAQIRICCATMYHPDMIVISQLD